MSVLAPSVSLSQPTDHQTLHYCVCKPFSVTPRHKTYYLHYGRIFLLPHHVQSSCILAQWRITWCICSNTRRCPYQRPETRHRRWSGTRDAVSTTHWRNTRGKQRASSRATLPDPTDEPSLHPSGNCRVQYPTSREFSTKIQFGI